MKKFIYKYLWWTYRPIKTYFRNRKIAKYRKEETRRLTTLEPSNKPRIFYLGITAHANLGDMAQYYCIQEWIKDNYPTYEVQKFESNVVTDTRFGFIQKFKEVYRPCDIIIFQSGYCTQDLGGDHDLMHRLICDNLPNARILMMPQTVFFQHEDNKLRTAKSYNGAKNMLFLARDMVSFEMAKGMFPDITVKVYPDIVTTLIGTIEFDNERNGVCLCTRNDGEKFYSDAELDSLTDKLSSITMVTRKDTQSKANYKTIRTNLWKFIKDEIESYSHYDVTITDRYHGTIFSLTAGTPVIIIKTNDHKVTTGADWFKGVYDDYIYVANDLDDAIKIYKEVIQKKLSHKMQPHMKAMYYDKLKELFEKLTN